MAVADVLCNVAAFGGPILKKEITGTIDVVDVVRDVERLCGANFLRSCQKCGSYVS